MNNHELCSSSVNQTKNFKKYISLDSFIMNNRIYVADYVCIDCDKGHFVRSCEQRAVNPEDERRSC